MNDESDTARELRVYRCDPSDLLARIRDLEALTLAQAERIAVQSELLSRRAGRAGQAGQSLTLPHPDCEFNLEHGMQ